MPEPTPEEAREALRAVLYPGFRRDIVALGMVGDDLHVADGVVRVHLRPGQVCHLVGAAAMRASVVTPLAEHDALSLGEMFRSCHRPPRGSASM